MPSKSKAQARLMAAVAHNKDFAKRVGIPQSVGREFNNADRGRKFAGGGKVKGIRDLGAALGNWQVNKLPQEGFFSTLDELIETAPQDVMPAYMWQKYLQPGKMLKRDDVQFPLKAEELEYGGINNLIKDFDPDQRLTRQQVQEYVRKVRPDINIAVNRSGPDDYASNDMAHMRAPGGRDFPYIDEPQYDTSGLRHEPSVPDSYEESVTVSPNVGNFPSHFSPQDISWSRTTRHVLPGSKARPLVNKETGEVLDPDTFRLVEEIQSDRHSKAGEKTRNLDQARRYDQLVQRVNVDDDYANIIMGQGPKGIEDPLYKEFAQARDSRIGRRGYRGAAEQQRLDELSRQQQLLYAEQQQIRFKNHAGPLSVEDIVRKEELEDLLREQNTEINALAQMPPDAPFKDPRDYATLELRKQLLNSVRENDRFLGLTRGQDQIERYEQGMGSRESEGMRKMYDEVYPSVLKKEAGRYGAPVRDVEVPIKGGANTRPQAFVGAGVETFDDFVDYAQEIPMEHVPETLKILLDNYIDNIDVVSYPAAKRHIEQAKQAIHNLEDTIVMEAGPRGQVIKDLDLYQTRYSDAMEALGNIHTYWPQHMGKQINKSFPAAEITPEVADKIRRIGVPIFNAAGATALGSQLLPDEDQPPAEFADGGKVNIVEKLLKTIKDRTNQEHDIIRRDTPDAWEEGKTRVSYEARPKGAPRNVSAGSMDLTRDQKKAMSVGVHSEYQRRGIATALYDTAKEDLGHRLEPNPYQTDEGKALWEHLNKRGYAEGGKVPPKKTLDYWRAVADSLGNAIPFTTKDTKGRLSDSLARPLSGLASQVLTRDPDTGDMGLGAHPGIIDEMAAFPTLAADIGNVLSPAMRGRFGRGQPQFEAPRWAQDAQDRTTANYNSTRAGLNLAEPRGFVDNSLEALGVMAGQLPLPGSLAKRLGGTGVKSRLAQLLKKAGGAGVEWLTPTVDPKVGNYLKGALFGGTMGGASDKIEDVADARQQDQWVEDAIAQVLAESQQGSDADDDAAIEEAVKTRFAEGGKVGGLSKLLKMINPDFHAEVPQAEARSPVLQVTAATQDALSQGRISPVEAQQIQNLVQVGDEETLSKVLLQLNQKLFPPSTLVPATPPPVATPAPLPGRGLLPPGPFVERRLLKRARGGIIKSYYDQGGEVYDEGGVPVPVSQADPRGTPLSQAWYENYGAGPEHKFFGERQIDKLEGWSPVHDTPPRAPVGGSGSSLGNLAPLVGAGLAAAPDLYDWYTGRNNQGPSTVNPSTLEGAGDTSDTNQWIEDDLSDFQEPNYDPTLWDQTQQVGGGALDIYSGLQQGGAGGAGSVLGGAGQIADVLGYDQAGNALGTAGNALGNAGDIYSGLQQGDAQGYLQAGSGAANLADTLGYGNAATQAVGNYAPYIGAAINAAGALEGGIDSKEEAAAVTNAGAGAMAAAAGAGPIGALYGAIASGIGALSDSVGNIKVGPITSTDAMGNIPQGSNLVRTEPDGTEIYERQIEYNRGTSLNPEMGTYTETTKIPPLDPRVMERVRAAGMDPTQISPSELRMLNHQLTAPGISDRDQAFNDYLAYLQGPKPWADPDIDLSMIPDWAAGIGG